MSETLAFRFGEHDTGEVRLGFAEIGDSAAPLIICLHGFPEYWAAWREVMARLADRYRVVAPDQRGYNRSSKPEGVNAYRGKHLVADIASLADRLSTDEPFVLAGHDWGASVAYAFAMRHPERLSHLVIANGVHPVCFQRAIVEDPDQRQASQYINLLRSDGAEGLLSEDGYRRLFGMIEKFAKADFMDEQMRAGFLDAWSQPGALTAMLNWYRASPIEVPEPGQPAEMPDMLMGGGFEVKVPHLLLWGEADDALRPPTMEGLAEFAPKLTVQRVADAGHWILYEKPEQVAEAIYAFLDANSQEQARR